VTRRLFRARGLLAPPDSTPADAATWILDHDWPGYVRELKSDLQRAVALEGEVITCEQ
jgi:transcriptional regulator with AAA-type ATPase domain